MLVEDDIRIGRSVLLGYDLHDGEWRAVLCSDVLDTLS